MKLRTTLALLALTLPACAPGEALAPPAPARASALDAGATTTANVPVAKAANRAPVPPVPLAEYFKVRRVPPASRSGNRLLSFSHDETKVAFAADLTGRIDVWVRPIAGGAPVQVTHVEGFVHSFAFSPKADMLVFEADRGGDELPRLYATDAAGSAARELVPELPQGRRTELVEWASDGRTFLYLSNGRDEKAMDLVEYDVASKKSTVLWKASGSFAFAATNPAHTTFALSETHSDTNTDVWVVGRKGKPELLTKHEGDVRYEPAMFSHDGKRLFLQTDEEGEHASLVSLDLATKAKTKELSAAWDVDGAGLSRTGKYRYTEVNADGVPKLELTLEGKRTPVALPTPPGGQGAFVVLGFSPSDKLVGLSLTSDTSPATSYVLDLGSGALTQLVDPWPASLRDRRMIAGESVKIPSFDGKTVPAFLYRPEGAKGPVPALIDVHGGPTSQSRKTFSAFRQYLVSKGYAVLVPNVRGSTGYGKSYTKLDNLDLGGGPLEDVVACKRWMVANAGVDTNRVVVFGGSYGGYMALAAEAFTPDEFAANVDFFGVSDLRTLVESFPPYWASISSFIFQKFGDPKNPAHARYQHDRSPIHFVSKMKKPLLVVQGDKDARVKKDQSDRIVAGLAAQKVPVHYLVLENEGHGFTKTENNLKALDLTDRFLDRYLFEDTSGPALPGPGAP